MFHFISVNTDADLTTVVKEFMLTKRLRVYSGEITNSDGRTNGVDHAYDGKVFISVGKCSNCIS
jgi:hypothetical protein